MPVAVALATFLVFSGALGNDFVDWDDARNFLVNPHFPVLGWANLRWAFLPSSGVTYSPLVWLLFSLTHAFWGLDPRGYHLTGVLVHVAVAVLLYHVTILILQSSAPGRKNDSPAVVRWSAGLATLLFALHPLRVEAVAWASAQHHALASLFFLASSWSYLKSRAARDARGTPGRWPEAALLCYALSLLSGPIGATLPVVLLILDVYLTLSRDGDLGKLDLRARLREKAPYFALAVLAGAATLRARAASGGFVPVARHGVGERVLQALFGLAFYFWKTLVPLRLSPLYPLPDRLNLLDRPFLLSGIFVASMTVAALGARRRCPAVLAAWTYYIVVLLPVLGLAQFGQQLVADRYSYLASIGLAVLAAGASARLWRAWGARARQAAGAAAAAALFALSGLTVREVKAWHDSESLWRSALETNPDAPLAHYNLGNVLFERGEIAEAIRQYELTLKSWPNYPRAHNNLGLALYRQGKLDDAIGHYDLALRAAPNFAEAHYDLGLALSREGKTREAIRHYELALESRPDWAAVRDHLRSALAAVAVHEPARP